MRDRVSILTEDHALAQTLSDSLIATGFEVQVLSTAPKYWQRTRTFMSSLLVVDLDTFGKEALAQCRHLRALSSARMLIVARPGHEEQMLQAFRAGIDDYMAKPVSQAELAARAEALLRRRRDGGGFRVTRIPICQDILLDTESRTLYVRGQRTKLTPIEYNLLYCLVQGEGQVVPRGALLNRVWGNESPPGVGSLNLYIYYLRHKIEHDPRRPQRILTKWGVGYYLVSDDAGPADGRPVLAEGQGAARQS